MYAYPYIHIVVHVLLRVRSHIGYVMGQKQQPERIATKGTSAFGRLTPLYFYPPPIDHICMTIKQVRTLTPQPNKLSTTQPPRL